MPFAEPQYGQFILLGNVIHLVGPNTAADTALFA